MLPMFVYWHLIACMVGVHVLYGSPTNTVNSLYFAVFLLLLISLMAQNRENKNAVKKYINVGLIGIAFKIVNLKLQ